MHPQGIFWSPMDKGISNTASCFKHLDTFVSKRFNKAAWVMHGEEVLFLLWLCKINSYMIMVKQSQLC